MHGLSLEDSEARPNELLKAEILRNLKGIIGLVEHLDTIQRKDPELISHVTVPDQVECSVEEPDLVWVHRSAGFTPPAHGVVDDLDGFLMDSGVIDPVDDLLEFAVRLVWLQPQVESPVKVFQPLTDRTLPSPGHEGRHVRHPVRESGQFQTDQGAIWSEISERVSRRGSESPSMVLAEICEKDRLFLQEYGGHFRCIDSQVGAVFMINGRVAGMEGFGKADSFAKTFKKLVENYVLDAVDSFEPDKKHKTLKSEYLGDLAIRLAEKKESLAHGRQ